MGRAARRSPGWACALCAALVLLSAAAFGRVAGAYPVPFVDESFFPAPAVAAAAGGAFAHPARADAPHADRVWAYHGPLYPRLLVPVFRAFGVSVESARLPSVVAAHAAILVLCGTLLARGQTWPSLTLACCWVGDRAVLETLYARPEGVCLFALAVGFAAAANRRPTLAGLALGAACGVQPIALFFPAVGLGWALAGGRRVVARYAAGAAVAGAATLLATGGGLAEAVAQFRWHVALYRTEQTGALPENAARVFAVLGWSRYWAAAALLVGGGWAAWAVAAAVRRRPAGRDDLAELAALFAVAGLLGVVVLAKCAMPYNLAVLTVWPVLAVAAGWDARNPRLWAAAGVLAAGWLPSAGWNLMRVREAVLFAGRMDPGPAREAIRRAVPPGATLGLERQVGLVGWSVGRRAELLPWLEPGQRPPADWWLLVSAEELASPDQLATEALAGRAVVLDMPLYPPGSPVNRRVVVFGPVRPPAAPPGRP